MSRRPTDTTLRGRAWPRELSHLRSIAGKRLLTKGPDSNDGHLVDDALALCDGMVEDIAARDLECRRLHAALQAQTRAWEYLFERVPVACVATDRNGCIVDANPAAAVLLNVGPKRLQGRQLMLFSTDRTAFADVLRRATPGSASVESPMVLRPRERKPVAVRANVAPPLPGGSDVWLWFLTGASEQGAAAAPGVTAAADPPCADGEDGPQRSLPHQG